MHKGQWHPHPTTGQVLQSSPTPDLISEEEEEEEEEEIIIYIISGPFSVGPMHYQGFVYYTMFYTIQILVITYILYFGINESHCRRRAMTIYM
jgi:hypothetical protein